MEDFLCSVCGEKITSETMAIKWNQDMKKGWGICVTCRNKYLEVQTHGNKIEKDSYNYFTTTVRQLLVRHGFSLNEMTIGSLRTENYVKWSLRATSPNDYFLKVHFEVEKKDVKDYNYQWKMRTYDSNDTILKEAESDKPNVKEAKEFLNKFFNFIGSNPYLYFRSTLKSILNKHKIPINEISENDDISSYKGGYTNGKYRWEAKVEKDFKWEVKFFALKGKSKIVEEASGNSFALTPLKEFFNKLVKKY